MRKTALLAKKPQQKNKKAVILLFLISKDSKVMKISRHARPQDIRMSFNSHPRQSSDSRNSIQAIQLEYQCRRKFRQNKLSQIKVILDDQTQGNLRKKQAIFLYFINLLIPMSMSFLIAYVFLYLYENRELKAILLFSFAIIGFFTAVISNLLIAPWREVLRMYLQIDSIGPILISAVIAFYSVLNFFGLQEWYKKLYATSFPIWAVYMTGNLRIQIAYAKWTKWQVVVYKLSMLFCGLVSFYIGYEYMMGKYKVTKGFFIQKQTQLRQLVYLYVFGNVELFFQLYRKLSEFDQTTNLKHEYCFQGKRQRESKIMADLEFKQAQKNAVQQQLNDLIAAHLQGQMFGSFPSQSQI